MTEETKKCPFCGEEILLIAIKCKHCEEILNKSAPQFQNQDKDNKLEKIQMRNTLGGIFTSLGIIVFIVFGLWGLIIEFLIVIQAARFGGIVISFMFLPVAFVAAPWYALVAWGDWFPLLIDYGGGIGASVLISIGVSLGD